jgi:hypothetical protein
LIHRTIQFPKNISTRDEFSSYFNMWFLHVDEYA